MLSKRPVFQEPVTIQLCIKILCIIYRMVESQRDNKPLFRDQREIEVAVDYMKGSGKLVCKKTTARNVNKLISRK